MGSLSVIGGALDRIVQAGGSIALAGGKIKLWLPEDCQDASEIVETIRGDREIVIAMLQDLERRAPSLDEVRAMLPPGVRVLRYEPKAVPFAVAPVSVVTTAGKFYRAYLRNLRWRVEHPRGCAAPPLAEILSKLADAGLELRLDRP
jgi:hypothetical protein